MPWRQLNDVGSQPTRLPPQALLTRSEFGGARLWRVVAVFVSNTELDIGKPRSGVLLRAGISKTATGKSPLLEEQGRDSVEPVIPVISDVGPQRTRLPPQKLRRYAECWSSRSKKHGDRAPWLQHPPRGVTRNVVAAPLCRGAFSPNQTIPLRRISCLSASSSCVSA